MYDIITIGTATIDIFTKSPFFDKSEINESDFKNKFPTGAVCLGYGSKIEIERPYITTGGGALNSAITFKKQGLKTISLFSVGGDEWGKKIISRAKKEKIDCLAKIKKNQTTATSIILLGDSGERTILVNRGASEVLTEKEIDLKKINSRWAYIVPGGISFSSIEKIFNDLNKKGVLTAFNPSKNYIEMGIEKLKPLFEKSEVVILNREEAAYLTGADFKNEKEIFEKFDEVVRGIVVMTDGDKGVYVSDGDYIYRAGIFSENKVEDRTGAGDAFGSGFIAGLMLKMKDCDLLSKSKNIKALKNNEVLVCELRSAIEYAIRFGSANATANIEIIGATEGILEKGEFERSKRWDNLPILTMPIKEI